MGQETRPADDTIAKLLRFGAFFFALAILWSVANFEFASAGMDMDSADLARCRGTLRPLHHCFG